MAPPPNCAKCARDGLWVSRSPGAQARSVSTHVAVFFPGRARGRKRRTLTSKEGSGHNSCGGEALPLAPLPHLAMEVDPGRGVRPRTSPVELPCPRLASGLPPAFREQLFSAAAAGAVGPPRTRGSGCQIARNTPCAWPRPSGLLGPRSPETSVAFGGSRAAPICNHTLGSGTLPSNDPSSDPTATHHRPCVVPVPSTYWAHSSYPWVGCRARGMEHLGSARSDGGA